MPALIKEPTLGAIRLAWWRDALAAIHAGKRAEQHPALAAYAVYAHGLSAHSWRDFIEATAAWIGASLNTWEQAETLIERSHAPVLRLVAAALSAGEQLDDSFVGAAARTWGYVDCLRAARAALLPGALDEALGRARGAYAELRKVPLMPATLFPAFGHLTLTPLYLRAFARGRRGVPLLHRQLRMIGAAATGRL